MLTISAKEVRGVLNATFPGYRKKNVFVSATTKVTIGGLNWDGGSRSEFAGCTVAGESTGNLSRYSRFAPWDRRQLHGVEVLLESGLIIVEAGYFCGKPATAHLYVHPDDMPKLLPSS